MPEKKLNFIGLLANTDSSILKVSLDHGFKVESLPEKKGTSLISILENVSPYEAGKKFFLNIPCLNSSEKKYYFITNSVGDVETDKSGRWNDNQALNMSSAFHNRLVCGYLEPTIRLMRLFKEGNIYMPVYYYFFIDNSIPKTPMSRGTSLYTPSYLDERYTLENSEIPSLETFIQNTRLPFAQSFLELAFENFELSYQTPNINLSFLSLMISLEALFNPGRQELRYRISRNTAVLLGKDRDDSEVIFSKIKELYEKRSAIVHKGEPSVVNKKELLKLRDYVRESIKKINRMDKDKNELLDMLNACGFGEHKMYYFAYGSNLSREQMSQRCRDAQPKCVATLPKHKLIFAGRSKDWNGGVASIKPCEGEKVIGAIYEISEQCLESLDIYENCPTTYGRENVTVFTGSDVPVRAITYVKVEQSDETQPSGEYLATIQQGYKDWGIV